MECTTTAHGDTSRSRNHAVPAPSAHHVDASPMSWSQPRERCVPRPPGRWATPVPDGGSRSVRPSLTTSAARATRAPIMRKCTARAGGVLGAACGLLGDSCGQAELAGRDTDYTLEVLGELALIREADAHRDL